MDIYTLGPLINVSNYTVDLDDSLVPAHPPPLPSPSQLTNLNTIKAETYVYLDENNLLPELWSFEEFVKNNAEKWYRLAGESGGSGVTEADRRGNK